MEKKCRFCSRVCHKQEHLDRHERTHTKVRPYRCEACEKHFVRRCPSPKPRIGDEADGGVDSDTLKRHQKLHLAETEKPLKRSAKSGAAKRSSGRGSDASRSDISLESPVDKQSPSVGEAEVEAPQFSEEMTTVYALDAWNFNAIDVLFPGLAEKEEETMENLFEESFGPFEDGSIESRSTDFTINPGDIWGNL
jgi:hypothetical protein